MQNRRLNVLQLSSGLGRGGAEMKLLELVANMDRDRFKNTICSLDIGGRDLAPGFQEAGCETIFLPRKKRVDWLLISQLIHIIKTRRIDVLLTTLYYADILGQLAGAFSGVKAAYSWETSSAPEYIVTRRLIPYRFVTQFADKVVAVSNGVASYLSKQRQVPESKIQVIPYGVDLSKYSVQENSRIRREFGFSQKDIVIGLVGRLEPDKGHDFLIESAEQLKNPNVKYVFVGKGGLESSFKKQIQERGLTEKFTFLGFRKDIHQILTMFDIVTLPSLHEGLPNAILEAMACGKPIVGTAVGGIPEAVLHNKTGLVIEPGCSNALRSALDVMISDESLRHKMGAAARHRMETVYSLEKQIEAFETLLSSKF